MGVSRTVLVVDDSASIRQMVTFTLQEGGFAVMEATNGKEGLERLAQAKADLIITDLNMPVMDGITFIRQARALAGSKFTPILMLTTESQDAKKQEGRAAGATGWIVKPFNPEKLLQVLAKVLP
jgi:two-component system, chemotaxis family, chemotaxis protein CheY